MAKLRGHSGLTNRGLERGTSAPSGAGVGQMWFNTSTGVLYQYTNDGASSFWLDVSSGGIGNNAGRGVDYVGDTDPGATHNGGSATLAVGQVYYNRTRHAHFVCTNATSDANVWAGTSREIGGTRKLYSTFALHTFTSSGIFTTESAITVDYLVVAGGGASSRSAGATGANAGGGAGGLLTGTGLSLPAGSYTITVGAGGIGKIGAIGYGTAGGNSSIVSSAITDIIATGGGYGGAGHSSYFNGGPGGSSGGGGGSGDHGTKTASPAQGNNGGDPPAAGAGGGGGAGAVGADGTGNDGGAGGAGTNIIMGLSNANSTTLLAAANAGVVSGSYRYLAGGGGGGDNAASAGGAGGIGGGGAASSLPQTTGGIGIPNTGGGAGGSGYASVNGVNGGSGIVILRIPL